MLDPCGTLARTSLPDECWPLRTSLCFRDFKKSVKIFKGDPPIPFCSILLMRPLCQTLLKYLKTNRVLHRTDVRLTNIMRC